MPTEQQENLGLTVFVTGSSTGIGRLTVETAARKGDRVYASMRRTNSTNREAAESLRRQAESEN